MKKINITNTSVHIARTNLFYFLNVLIQAVRGFILIPLFLRFIGLDGYGQWVLVMSWAGYAGVIALLGLDLAIYQYVTPELRSSRGRAIYWTIARVVFYWATSMVCASIIVVLIFEKWEWQTIVTYTGVYVIGQALWMIFLTPFRCEERPHIFLGIQVMINIGDLLVVVGALYTFLDMSLVLLSMCIYHMSMAVILFLTQLKRFPYSSMDSISAYRYVKFGLSMALTQLINMGFFVMDKTIIGHFAGLRTLASYGPALSLALVLLPLSAAGMITLPTLLVNNEIKASVLLKAAVLQSAIKQWALLALPCALGIALTAHFALTTIASPELARIGTPIAWAAVVAVFAEGLGRFANVVLRTENDIFWPVVVKAIHFVAFIILSIWAVFIMPQNAGLGVIMAVVIANISYMIFCYIRLRLYIPRLPMLRIFLTPLFGCAAISMWYVCFPNFSTLHSALFFVVVSIIAYGGVVMSLERVGPRKLARTLFRPSPPEKRSEL